LNTEVRITSKIIWSILLLMLISRGLLLFTGYIGMNLFSKYTTVPVYQENVPGSLSQWKQKLPGSINETEYLKLEDFIKFDTYAYLKIATEGYDKVSMDQPHTAANWVFFPLYPLLIYLAGFVLWQHPAIIGIILSNVFLFAALTYVYRIALQRGLSEKQAGAVLFLILIYPSSLYFSIPYTESLFLLLSAAAVYYATNKQYAWAFLAASLSTVTRVPGFINLAFVLGSVLIDGGFRITKNHFKWLLYSLLSLVPMGAYLLHMKGLTGDLLAPFHEQSLHWYRYTTTPFKNYIGFILHPYFSTQDGWDNGFIAFIVSSAVFLVFIVYLIMHAKSMARDLRKLLFFVYGVMLIVIPFSSQPLFLVSVVRYMMVSIPFYIFLVSLTDKRDKVLMFYQMLFFILQVIVTIAYFNGFYFVI
jgi:Gpi18-like mannosyltransferase